MQLDVQWFISALADNNIITAEDGISYNEQLGGDPSLIDFAQALLGALTEGMSEADAASWQEQIQQVLNYASEQAATGAVPPAFASMQEGGAAAAVSLPPPEYAGDIPNLREVSSMNDEQVKETMIQLLFALRALGASDLHLVSSCPAFIRKELVNSRIDPEWVMPLDDVKRLVYSIMTPEQISAFEEQQDFSFGLQIGQARFRTALMCHKQGMAAAFRLVPDQLQTLENLGFFPEDAVTIKRLLDYSNGLILVTGPLGAGKTTTLASMVDIANHSREDHIITVEDPIEIIQTSQGCQITQREIGSCTNSYHAALKGALREDPDIIVIGEMRDLETIENAITASETGHLVVGTLHTCDAANTLNRILDVFPPAQQVQIRTMVSGSLRGIVCQQLIPKIGGGLTIVYEILVATVAISNLIADGKTSQLKATMEIGSRSGMCTMDQNILKKYQAGIIDADVARYYVKDHAIKSQIDRLAAIEEAKKLQAQIDAKKHKK